MSSVAWPATAAPISRNRMLSKYMTWASGSLTSFTAVRLMGCGRRSLPITGVRQDRCVGVK